MVDNYGRTSKPLRLKRNCSDPMSTAALKVARPNKAAAQRLLKKKLCRCGHANCKYAHGPRELKHAPDLKKPGCALNSWTDAAQKGAACPFAHSCEGLRVTASVHKTQLCHFFGRGSYRKGLGADTRTVSGSCDVHSPSSPSIPSLGRSPSRGSYLKCRARSADLSCAVHISPRV